MVVATDNSRNMWQTGGRRNFPIDSLALYLPLWHPELSGSTITSKDLNARSCTVTGAVHNPPTHRQFDNIDDKIDCGNIISSGTQLIIECWYKSAPNSTNQSLVETRNSTGGNGVVLYIDSNGKVNLYSTDGGGIVTTITVDDSTWHHLLSTTDGTSHEIFVDGVSKASGTKAFTGFVATSQCLVGMDYAGSVGSSAFSIGEVRCYVTSPFALAQIEHNRLAARWRYV